MTKVTQGVKDHFQRRIRHGLLEEMLQQSVAYILSIIFAK